MDFFKTLVALKDAVKAGDVDGIRRNSASILRRLADYVDTTPQAVGASAVGCDPGDCKACCDEIRAAVVSFKPPVGALPDACDVAGLCKCVCDCCDACGVTR